MSKSPLRHRPLRTPAPDLGGHTQRPFIQTELSDVWGLVPIKGPAGGARGYMLLVERPSRLARMTVERHFIPGVGLVREVLVSALNGKMVNRHEMVLQK